MCCKEYSYNSRTVNASAYFLIPDLLVKIISVLSSVVDMENAQKTDVSVIKDGKEKIALSHIARMIVMVMESV